MIGRVLDMLGLGPESGGGRQPAPGEELRLAAAAILVEAALTDGEEDTRELDEIRRALGEHFGLDAGEVDRLVAQATRVARDSVDWNRFTRVLKQGFEAGERLWIMEKLWTVVLADGELHAWEDTLVRQVASLLAIDDRDRALARRRALEGLGQGHA